MVDLEENYIVPRFLERGVQHLQGGGGGGGGGSKFFEGGVQFLIP